MTNQLVIPSTMTAWVQDRYGDSSRFERRDVPVPELAADEVLVRVAATSLNAADRYMSDPALVMRPMLGGLRGPKDPIGGLDVSGTVAALGSDVSSLAVGDRVFGEVGGGFGAFCAAKASRLAVVPDTVSLDDAAGVPIAGLTALQGLRNVAEVSDGAAVLVNGASGGVGTFAVQIARALGATVTAVCSTKNVELARSLGSTDVVDYRSVDVIDHFTSAERRFDVIFDVAGVHSVRERSRLLMPDGICVFVGAPSGGRVAGPIPALLGSIIAGRLARGRFSSFVAESNGDDMAVLAEMMASGAVRTVVEDVMSIDEVPAAMTRFKQGHLAGKLILTH